LIKVEFTIDPVTDLPTGSAVVTLAPGSDPLDASLKLSGEDCGGRTIKAYPADAVGGKRNSFGGGGGSAVRYFEEDVSLKCFACQQVRRL
jgi:hypothetical protein